MVISSDERRSYLTEIKSRKKTITPAQNRADHRRSAFDGILQAETCLKRAETATLWLVRAMKSAATYVLIVLRCWSRFYDRNDQECPDQQRRLFT